MSWSETCLFSSLVNHAPSCLFWHWFSSLFSRAYGTASPSGSLWGSLPTPRKREERAAFLDCPNTGSQGAGRATRAGSGGGTKEVAGARGEQGLRSMSGDVPGKGKPKAANPWESKRVSLPLLTAAAEMHWCGTTLPGLGER